MYFYFLLYFLFINLAFYTGTHTKSKAGRFIGVFLIIPALYFLRLWINFVDIQKWNIVIGATVIGASFLVMPITAVIFFFRFKKNKRK